MAEPRVTIVIPCFNYARFLSSALQSVLAQTFDRWECIIVDDGSTDDTRQVTEAWVARDSRFRLIKTAHRGPSAARNEAISAASTEFVQFLDADDRLLPTKLENHVRYLDANPSTDIVYGHVGYFTDARPDILMHSPFGKLSAPLTDRVHGNAEALEKLEHYNFLPILAPLVRRSIFDKVGKLPEDVMASEDWLFWLCCAIYGCHFDYDGSDKAVAAVRAPRGNVMQYRRKMIRGLIDGARLFETTSAHERWRGRHDRLPRIIEFGLALDAVEHGRRWMGFRMIGNACRYSSVPLTVLRWQAYRFAALFLPRRVFFWFVTMPIPEDLLEWYRRLRRSFG